MVIIAINLIQKCTLQRTEKAEGVRTHMQIWLDENIAERKSYKEVEQRKPIGELRDPKTVEYPTKLSAT